MMDVMTCVIFESPFGNEPGHEVALFEEQFGAQEIKEKLEEEGFQASVVPGAGMRVRDSFGGVKYHSLAA